MESRSMRVLAFRRFFLAMPATYQMIGKMGRCRRWVGANSVIFWFSHILKKFKDSSFIIQGNTFILLVERDIGP